MTGEVNDIVVGSGPSALGAVLGLLAEGRVPLVVDIGTKLTAEDEAAIQEAAGRSPLQWTATTRAGLDRGSAALQRIAEKTYFGTDVPYRYPSDRGVAVEHAYGDRLPLSGALGGLSTVWGAGVLALGPAELARWPIDGADLRSAYHELGRHVPIVGRPDALDDRFPHPGAFTGPVPTSRRFAQVLERTDRQHSDDVIVGMSRLAVRPLGSGCTGCGRCLLGCPYGAILNAGDMLRSLVIAGKVRYAGGEFVTSIAERGAAQLESVDAAGVVRTRVAERIFIAAGPIATVALLQRSGLAPSTVEVRDSQVFYLPLVHATPPSRDAAHFTLAQLFAVSADPEPRRDFQFSMYDTSDELRARLRSALPRPVDRVIGRWAGQFVQVMTAGIGFVHSDASGTLAVSTSGLRTAVTPRPSPATLPAIRSVVRRLGRRLSRAGVLPVQPALQVPGPGVGFHVGAGMPMAERPGPASTDTFGRPYGATVIHVVDATVVPALHPGPTTFTAMANAYRIARSTTR